jgi:predicted nucleic acid-binding protein
MSFDLAVWYPEKRIDNDEARELYVRLCDGDTSGVVANPAIDAFYAELTARYPEIDTIPEEKLGDHDYCPWSCKLDRSPGHTIMPCVWPKATDVYRLVENLARKHGLALYDPQSDAVIYPDGSKGTTAKTGMSRGASWTLGTFALLFALIFVYSGKTGPSGASWVLYVFAALCGLLAMACFRQARRDSGDTAQRRPQP